MIFLSFVISKGGSTEEKKWGNRQIGVKRHVNSASHLFVLKTIEQDVVSFELHTCFRWYMVSEEREIIIIGLLGLL